MVILAVRQGFFNVQTRTPRLPTQEIPRVALDLSMPTTNHRAFSHRLIGIYVPWDPGGTKSFLALNRSALPRNYILRDLSGDFNASLSAFSLSNTASLSQLLYSQFRHDTKTVDLWRTQQPLVVMHEWRPIADVTSTLSNRSFNILDRVATPLELVFSQDPSKSRILYPCNRSSSYAPRFFRPW